MRLVFATVLTISHVIAIGQSASSDDTLQRRPGRATLPPIRSWQAMMDGYLRSIQSGDSDMVEFTVYDIATVWAAAGFIQQANRLLTRLWSYHIKDPNDFRYFNDGFRILWALSGKQPDHIPFPVKPVDEIVQDNWDGLFNRFPGISPVVPDSIGSKSWKELSGIALAEKAILLSFDDRQPYHRAGRPAQEQAVLAFSRYFADQLAGSDAHHSTIAAIVAAGLGRQEDASAFIRQFGFGFLRIPQSSLFLAELLKDTAVARYLLHGVLAPVWRITDSSCTADLKRCEAVLARRMSNGPSLAFGQLTLKALLQRLSESAINKKDIDYEDAVLRSRWLGYPPAQDEQINAAEKRLGIDLPEDYKSFIRVTNGFKAVSNVGVSFLPVDSIGWLRDLDKELVDILGTPMSNDPPDSASATEFRRAILIGGYREEQQFLLIPPAGKEKEWKYWFYAFWTPGITAHPSLRFYLESELQFLMDN
jgi:SMI1 / KNR4 family (SUKH-1)